MDELEEPVLKQLVAIVQDPDLIPSSSVEIPGSERTPLALFPSPFDSVPNYMHVMNDQLNPVIYKDP